VKNSEKLQQYLEVENFDVETYYKMLMYKPLSTLVVLSNAERFLVLMDELLKNKFIEFCNQNNINFEKFNNSEHKNSLKDKDVSWGKVAIGGILAALFVPQIFFIAGAGYLTHYIDKKTVSKEKFIGYARKRIETTINGFYDFIEKVEVDQLSKAINIEQFAKVRNIEYLCHLTRLENIENILKFGILSREILKVHGIAHYINDDKRYDNNKRAISLSVSKINKHYLRSKKEQFDGSFAIIYIGINLLYDNDTKAYFYRTNAANKSIKAGIGLSGFKDMFADVVEYEARGEKRVIVRKHYKRQSFETTDEQAEILFEGKIGTEYIDRIIVNKNDVEKLKLNRILKESRVKIVESDYNGW
jgi:hypothetical protein